LIAKGEWVTLTDETNKLTDQADRLLLAVREAGMPTDASAALVLECVFDTLDHYREILQVLENLLISSRLSRPDTEVDELDSALVDLGVGHEAMQGVGRLISHAKTSLMRIERDRAAS
jgi:hypothetical protein